MRRTGTAATMAERTRKPTALAIASSRRCFSCSALTLVSGWPLLLRTVYGAFGVSADFANLAFFGAFGDDGLGHGFAGLVLRPIPLLLRFAVLRLDFDVLVAGQGRAAFGWVWP